MEPAHDPWVALGELAERAAVHDDIGPLPLGRKPALAQERGDALDAAVLVGRAARLEPLDEHGAPAPARRGRDLDAVG